MERPYALTGVRRWVTEGNRPRPKAVTALCRIGGDGYGVPSLMATAKVRPPPTDGACPCLSVGVQGGGRPSGSLTRVIGCLLSRFGGLFAASSATKGDRHGPSLEGPATARRPSSVRGRCPVSRCIAICSSTEVTPARWLLTAVPGLPVGYPRRLKGTRGTTQGSGVCPVRCVIGSATGLFPISGSPLPVRDVPPDRNAVCSVYGQVGVRRKPAAIPDEKACLDGVPVCRVASCRVSRSPSSDGRRRRLSCKNLPS